MASEPLFSDTEPSKTAENKSVSVLNDLSFSASLAVHEDSSSDDWTTKENDNKQQDDNDDDADEDDYDPELALTVPEPCHSNSSVAVSHPEPEASKTSPNSGSISDADSESDYEPEIPPETPGTAEKTEDMGEAVVTESGERPSSTKKEDAKADFVLNTESVNGQELLQDIAPNSPSKSIEQEPESGSESDDYDPEQSLLPGPPENEPVPTLPPKPDVQPKHETPLEAPDLKEAYEAIMQSEVVRLEYFAQLSKEKQMEVIQGLLREKQIALPSSERVSEPITYADQTSPNQNFAPIHPDDGSGRPYLSIPMTEEERQAYAQFLIAEAEFMNSSEELPEESRLFVGNLPSNSIKKEDLFRIFRRYGDLLEITIKAGFGFAQFKTNEACAACKKGEAGIPLHNRLLRLDFSHLRRTNREGLENGGRGRERSAEDGYQESESKRAKTDVVDVYVLVTDQAEEEFVSDVEEALQNDNLTHSQKNIGSDDPAEEIREAAYLGIVGVCVIKDAKVDLQIFEETGDGGVKFDEYLDIEPSAASEIIVNAKRDLEKRISEVPKPDSSRRTERSNRYKQGQVAVKHSEFLDDRRGYSEKPYTKFNHSVRGRGHGRQTWQRSNGFQGRPKNDWDREPSYPGHPEQGADDFYQGHGPMSNSNLYQAPAYNGRYGGGQHFQLQGGYNNQGYGRHSYQNSGGYQGNQRQNSKGQYRNGPRNYNGQMGFNSMPLLYPQPPQAVPAPAPADPALMQTLQNLDPNTMRSVVALLQQQGGSPGTSPGVPISNGPPMYQNTAQLTSYQQGSPSAQVNSLLAQLQSQPTPLAPPILTPYSQQPQPQQPYNSASPQQPQPNEALMNMLSRLGGQ